MPEFRINGVELANLAEGILDEGHILRFRAKGWSMWPFIRDGDLIEIQSIQSELIRLGDVLLYIRESGGLVVHRVVRKLRIGEEMILVMRGDSQPSADGAVCTSQVKGRVVAVERGDQRISMDTPARRFLARLWLAMFPFSLYLLRSMAGVRRILLSTLRKNDWFISRANVKDKEEEKI